MSDRGMKKWAPYRSLPEQDIANAKLRRKKNQITKPLISSEEAEEINNILINHNKDILIFSIYREGNIIQFTGIIKKIDEVNKIIILEDRSKILFKEIINIKRQ